MNAQQSQSIEIELLNYITEKAESNNPDSVIKCIDDFCWNNHWMMHVGDEKGIILENAVKDVVKNSTGPVKILELGTYCGYSSLRMARNLRDGDKIYTVDPNMETIEIAKQIINKAGLLARVEFVHGFSNEMTPKLQYVDKFNLVFFDHVKKQYFSDLELLEKCWLVAKGTCLVADNVVVFKIEDYLNYVQNKDRFITDVYNTKLEYSKDRDDGIVVSVYL